jgi:hypothetical protein
MTQKAIGPNFSNELAAAGLTGLPFSWSPDGTLTFMPAMTSAEISAVEAVYAAHNPATPDPIAAANALVVAGIPIVSTSTPALNATYAIDTASKTVIDGIYSGIKDGDGLPGGGATFNYPDIVGAPHAFSAATFPGFAKAVRDYLYAISQGSVPATPVTIA